MGRPVLNDNQKLLLGAGASAAAFLGGISLLKARAKAAAHARRVRKGMFIEYAVFDAPARELRELGIEWVLVQTGVQKADKSPADFVWRTKVQMEKLYQRLNPQGATSKIELWGWGWPIPTGSLEFADHVRSVLSSPMVTGYCLNVERKSWDYSHLGAFKTDHAAHLLVEEIRKGTSKPVSLSSHGRADLHDAMPWGALKMLDGALPQAYDKDNRYGDGFIERCIDSYRGMGFDAVYPTLGATKSSAARVAEQLQQFPAGVLGVSWWSWTSIGRSEAMKAAIADWRG